MYVCLLIIILSVSIVDAKSNGDEEGDGYFGDCNGDAKALHLVAESTKKIVGLANSYTGAAGMVQRAGVGIDDGNGEEGGGVGVVLNACSVHLQDVGHYRVLWGHGKEDDFDMDRLVDLASPLLPSLSVVLVIILMFTSDL